MLQFLFLALVGLGGAVAMGGSSAEEDIVEEDEVDPNDDSIEEETDPGTFLVSDENTVSIVGTDGDDDLCIDTEDFDETISVYGESGSDRFVVLPFAAMESEEEVIAELPDFDPVEDDLYIDTNDFTAHNFDIGAHVSGFYLERDDEAGTTNIFLELSNEQDNSEPVTKRIVVHSEQALEQENVLFLGISEHSCMPEEEWRAMRYASNETPEEDFSLPDPPTFLVSGDGDDVLSANTGGHTVLAGAGDDEMTLNIPEDSEETNVFMQSGDDTVVANGSNLGIWGGSGDDYVNSVDAASSVSIQGGEGNDTIAMAMGQYVHGGSGHNSYILHLDDDFSSREPAEITNLKDSSLEIRIPAEAMGDLEIENQFTSNGHYLVRSVLTISGVEVAHIIGGMPEGEGGLLPDDPRIVITSV